MKLRNWIALLLALVLCMSSVSFAFADEEKTHLDIVGEEREALFAATDALDTTGKTYDEHIVIDFAVGYIKSGVDYNTCDLLAQWFCEHFNIEWNIEALPSDGTDDKVRTMINSDSMTDVLRWDNYYIDEIIEYIDQGYFYQFPEDWEERWPKLAALQQATPMSEILHERTDGNNYALFRPTYFFNNPSDKGVTPTGVILRKDWAEAVGFELKDVYTPSELLEYARLIKEQDPGNVGERLIPLSLYTSNARDTFITTLWPKHSSLYNDNGEYKWGFADERTLEGLKLWQTAYREGLIGSEFFTLSSTDSKNAYNISGISGGYYGTINQGWLGDAWDGLKDQGLDPEECLWAAGIVGDDGYYHDNESANYWGAVYFSADIDEATFERYMDIAEFCVDRDVMRLVNIGFEGVDWEWADEESDQITKINGLEFISMWPLYQLMSICGDDFVMDAYNVSENAFLVERFASKVIAAKEACLTEDSIIPIDGATYGFSSDTQNLLSEINYKTIFANLVVSEGDLETEWKAVIDEYAYIVDPALAELNELFGTK